MKKGIFKNFEKFFSLRKIAITWSIFRIISIFFFYMITDVPHFINLGQQWFHKSKERSTVDEKSYGVPAVIIGQKPRH